MALTVGLLLSISAYTILTSELFCVEDAHEPLFVPIVPLGANMMELPIICISPMMLYTLLALKDLPPIDMGCTPAGNTLIVTVADVHNAPGRFVFSHA